MIAVKRNNLILLIAGIGFLLVYYLFDPLESRWMPQCIFHKLTGLQCIGCGSQRVIHSLLHGDLASALQANALLVVSLPFLGLLLWLEISRTRYPRLYARIHSFNFILVISIILLGWMIIRNVMGL